MLRTALTFCSLIATLTLSGCSESTPDPVSPSASIPSEATETLEESTAAVNQPVESEPVTSVAAADPSEDDRAGTDASDDDASPRDPVTKTETKPTETKAKPQPDDEPEFPDATKLPADLISKDGLTPLNPAETVLLDVPNKRVFVKTNVCFTEGVLEMLLCLTQTKEHESILVFDGKAQTIHAGLLALGLKEGKPSAYDIDTGVYTPASGKTVDIFLHWTDKEGNLHRERAQSWCRNSRFRYYEESFETLPADLKLDPDGNLRYDDMNKMLFWYGPMTDSQRDECLKMSADEKFQKAIRRFHSDTQAMQLDAEFIFVGSGFINDPDFGERYLAEGGYVICVANFAAAMIDLSIESSASGNENLTYEAWTERIPPRGSEVLVEIVPRPEKKKP
ncbi:MAG: YdjY domain-containing protein [Planctomycetota bacterium]|jgi:hypothetical protein